LAKTTLVDLSRIGPVNTKTTAVKQDKLRPDGTVSLELKKPFWQKEDEGIYR